VSTLKWCCDDLKRRYGNKKKSIVSNPDFERWVEDAFELEKQIFANTNIEPEDVNEEIIQKVMKFLS